MLVYLATLAPALTWAHWGADGGDFITAAVTGRMPHPPGFPLYLTLARLFVLLPIRDPAWRLNVLSAVMAAGTVALIAATLQREEKSSWLVLAAALTLAFAPLFWSQALITEVYTTAAFFAAWANSELRIMNHESRIMNHESRITNHESRITNHESPVTNHQLPITSHRWILAGLVCGLGMAVHPTLVLLMPLWLVYLLHAGKVSAIWKSRLRSAPPVYRLPSTVYRLLSTVSRLPSTVYLAGVFIGLLPYALLPLLGPWPQPWGDMRSFAGWWDVVTARLYWGYAFGLPLAEWPARLAAWAALLARQFTPLGGTLVLLGAWVGGRERQGKKVLSTDSSGYFPFNSFNPLRLFSREAIGLAAAGGLVSLFAIGYATSDSQMYLLPLLPLLIPLLSVGLRWLVDKGLPAWVTLALPLALLAWNWQAVDLHRDDAAVLWYNRVLAAPPADAVLLTAQSDAHTFALWYAQEAMGLRPDVVVIDENLWWQESYRQFLFAQTGYEVAVDAYAFRPEDFATRRPLCRIIGEEVVCP